jgi:hypothetical protein
LLFPAKSAFPSKIASAHALAASAAARMPNYILAGERLCLSSPAEFAAVAGGFLIYVFSQLFIF